LRAPEGIGEDDRAGASVLVLAGEEGASELRADAEHVEEAGGDPEGEELGALAAVAPDGGVAVVAGDGGEDRLVRLELADRWPGELEAGHVAAVLEDVDQAIWLRVGEAAKERGIDGGEDRGVEADAHREGEHDDGGEAGSAAEVAEGVPEVLAQCTHKGGTRFNGRARTGRGARNEVFGTRRATGSERARCLAPRETGGTGGVLKSRACECGATRGRSPSTRRP